MAFSIERVTVIGAGNMGSGIAGAIAHAGVEVTLNDLKEEHLEKGRGRIEKWLRGRVEKGKLTEEAAEASLARVRATTDLAEAVGGADLVIEAVFEDMKVKKEVFGRVSEAAPEACVFATNTSSLSVTDMAAVTDRPSRFAGLHFFFPANVNWLVEVVAGEETDADVVEALLAFSRRIGKVPIETADAAGFAVNRFFVPWVNEAVRLLDEGVADVPTIDAAAKEAFSIGMGPFELMNVTGVPISLHAQRSLHDAFGAFYEPAEGLVRQVEEVGEDWDLGGEPDASRFDAVARRLRGVTFGIACHLVEEGVATPRDTDKGATIGLRWAKGPFAMMNEVGLAAALEDVAAVHEAWGDDFPLPEELQVGAEEEAVWDLPLARVERRGHVAVVTVDRPEAMNALNPDVISDIGEAFAELQDDPLVRAVVLTGEGPKAFVAGADIKFMADKEPLEARKFTKLGQDVFRYVEQFERPVIAAVNGVALGGGFELALACDLIVADGAATFGLPEVGLGIHPGFGGTQRLPRLVGVQEAKRLIFTGERFGADEAKRLGVAVEVAPPGEALDRALALAEKVASKAPVAVRQAKSAVNRGLQADLDTGLGFELEAVTLTFATEDQKEAMRAFLERRKPEFKGR